MLGIDFIRENKEKVIQAAKNKNRSVAIEKILRLDEQRKTIIREEQKLREKRNQLTGQKPTPEAIKEGRSIKEKLKKTSRLLKKTEKELTTLLAHVPNVPLDDVPLGKTANDNVEVKKWGQIPVFGFKPRSHLDLIKEHDLADLKRGSKVSGYRGYFLKNELAVIQLAVLWYAFTKIIQKGYTPLIAPAIVKEFTLFGNGQFPWGREEVYWMPKDGNYLAGTAEVPVTAYYSGEILNEKDLPKRMVAFSPCFRREIGNYGKDTKGLYRVHEFWKVEQVVIGEAEMQKTHQYHQELQNNLETILQDLKIPYRVLLMCTGDMGEPQAKKYDTEVWIPSKNSYGEIASNSIMTDFQARRLKIRYRCHDGQIKYAYTLNNTGMASPRILIAILENYQQKDGSILIPRVLQPLTGFKKIKAKPSE